MILYLDTSALVKKYFTESGSADVISLEIPGTPYLIQPSFPFMPEK